MPLNVRLEWEGGDVIDEFIDHENVLIKLREQVDYQSTCCFRFIDPYGMTIFNRGQAAVLVEEIIEFEKHIQSDSEGDILAKLKALSEKCLREPHQYIRILGD